MGVFLFFGALMALLASTTLLWPGTSLDLIWKLNPNAYRQLSPLGRPAGIGFLILAVILAFAGTGWFKQKLWGWQLAVGVMGVQFLGDFANMFMGEVFKGAFGATIAGAIILYLFRPGVHNAFRGN